MNKKKGKVEAPKVNMAIGYTFFLHGVGSASFNDSRVPGYLSVFFK